jgi:hypothetical protein
LGGGGSDTQHIDKNLFIKYCRDLGFEVVKSL